MSRVPVKEIQKKLEIDKKNFSSALDESHKKYVESSAKLLDVVPSNIFHAIERRAWAKRTSGKTVNLDWTPVDELAVILKEALLNIKENQ